ncbi:MAG: hypothetical protein U0136_06130 [Bdellovibrionota bacterium]
MTDRFVPPSPLKERLEVSSERTHSEQELRLAAEAVVEAAIWRQRLRQDMHGGRADISETARQALVDLLYRDPGMTSFLFSDEAWERH